MLQGQLDRIGIEYKSFGMMEDDLECVSTEIVEKALTESNIVITTGGVWVGDYDYLPAIYERIGLQKCYLTKS